MEENPKQIIMFKWGSKEKPFRCQACHMTFEGAEMLKNHVAKHNLYDPNKPHKCSLCLKTFRMIKSLRNHTQEHYGVGTKRCKLCYKMFNNKEELDEHQAMHGGKRPFKCDECGEQFAFKTGLDNHILRHTGDRPFECEICNKRFNRKDILERHHTVHEGPKKWHECVECGKLFSHSSVLKKHARVMHNGEKDPQACNVCGKVIAGKVGLAKHMKIHTGEKEFVCPVCDRAFRQKQHMVDHMVIHTGEKPFQCTMCGISFKHKRALYKHRQIDHGDFKAHTCQECGKRFEKKSMYDRHQLFHLQKPYQCGHCKALFKLKGSYRRHMLRAHLESLDNDKDKVMQYAMKHPTKPTDISFRTETVDGKRVKVGACILDGRSYELRRTEIGSGHLNDVNVKEEEHIMLVIKEPASVTRRVDTASQTDLSVLKDYDMDQKGIDTAADDTFTTDDTNTAEIGAESIDRKDVANSFMHQNTSLASSEGYPGEVMSNRHLVAMDTEKGRELGDHFGGNVFQILSGGTFQCFDSQVRVEKSDTIADTSRVKQDNVDFLKMQIVGADGEIVELEIQECPEDIKDTTMTGITENSDGDSQQNQDIFNVDQFDVIEGNVVEVVDEEEKTNIAKTVEEVAVMSPEDAVDTMSDERASIIQSLLDYAARDMKPEVE